MGVSELSNRWHEQCGGLKTRVTRGTLLLMADAVTHALAIFSDVTKTKWLLCHRYGSCLFWCYCHRGDSQCTCLGTWSRLDAFYEGRPFFLLPDANPGTACLSLTPSSFPFSSFFQLPKLDVYHSPSPLLSVCCQNRNQAPDVCHLSAIFLSVG